MGANEAKIPFEPVADIGAQDPMTATVAEAILHEIRRDGFSVGEHELVDRVTGEAWTVNAPTA